MLFQMLKLGLGTYKHHGEYMHFSRCEHFALLYMDGDSEARWQVLSRPQAWEGLAGTLDLERVPVIQIDMNKHKSLGLFQRFINT